jgi:hypothetical protein
VVMIGLLIVAFVPWFALFLPQYLVSTFHIRI